MNFSGLHRTITMHVGASARVGHPHFSLPQTLTVTTYGVDGFAFPAQTFSINPADGNSDEITVTTGYTSIVSLSMTLANNYAYFLNIKDITLDQPTLSAPDFFLQSLNGASNYVSVTAGGPPVSLQLAIIRLGGSAGNIQFTPSSLPAGIHITYPFNPEGGAVVTVVVSADITAADGAFAFAVLGTPASAAVGPALRIYSFNLSVSHAFTIYGQQDVDLNTEPTAPPPNETVQIPLTIQRQGAVNIPATISVSGLPSNLTASFTKTTLPFAGHSIVDQTVLNLSVPIGVDIPDAMLSVKVTNGTVSDAFNIIVHGTIPRQNKDFTVKGSFFSNDLGFIRPVKNAVVEIYRNVDYGADHKDGETTTDANGNFQASFTTNDENTYYAKCVANDEQGVYLHDSWTLDIWGGNSYNRGSNKDNAVIDLGGTVFTEDNGKTVPRISLWQGSHTAYQEYISSVGSPPPTGDYEIRLWSGFETPYSYLSTTEWPIGYPNNFNPPAGTNDFNDYLVSFHEFGHTVRHSLDGNGAHFLYDATRFDYARSHSICESTNDGFAFNEGWAEFWSKDPTLEGPCPANQVGDFQREFNVAEDLTNLMNCTGKTRKDMVAVLQMGTNIIHSDAEYRSHFQQLFPDADLSKCPASGNSTTFSAQVSPPVPTIADSLHFQRALDSLITEQQHFIDQLQETATAARDSASRLSKEQRINGPAAAKALATILFRPLLLSAQMSEAAVLQKVYQHELEQCRRGARGLPNYDPHFRFEADSIAGWFDGQSRAIVRKLLSDHIAALGGYLSLDTSGTIKNIIGDQAHELKLISAQVAAPSRFYSMLKMPGNTRETTTPFTGSSGQTRGIGWRWILAGVLLVLLLLWLFIRRSKTANMV